MKTYPDIASARAALVRKGPAEWLLPIAGRKPVILIANDAIMAGFDDGVFEQAVNTAEAPGVDEVIILPDSHVGYGVPVGSVIVSNTHVYPAPVGPDIGCGMSLLQTDLGDDAINDRGLRRALINAICERLPTGTGSRQAPKARRIDQRLLEQAVTDGATPAVLCALGIPESWADRVECGVNGNENELYERLETLRAMEGDRTIAKLCQAGSYGGGNHMGECESVSVIPGMEAVATSFGLKHGCVGFLSHCGSRGFGFQLAKSHFSALEAHFKAWGIALPGGERELVHAPMGSPQADAYLLDMALGANFACINHLLINSYVLEAFQEVIPGVKGELVYHLFHNVLRSEFVDGRKALVGRKGTTRAFGPRHHHLKGTRYYETGHPALLPGNPTAGSYVMVGAEGGSKTAFSLNHGAGRALGRKAAQRKLDQKTVNAEFDAADILYNTRNYPLDESPAAYKDFEQVTDSVELAGLAKRVAHLRARFVIKDGDQSPEGAA